MNVDVAVVGSGAAGLVAGLPFRRRWPVGGRAGEGPAARRHLRRLRRRHVDAEPPPDPFHVLGLITDREIRRWNPAFGGARLSA
jgi:hypothetical protein